MILGRCLAQVVDKLFVLLPAKRADKRWTKPNRGGEGGRRVPRWIKFNLSKFEAFTSFDPSF